MKKSLAIISGLLSGVFALSLFGCGKSDWHGKDDWLYKEDTVPTEESSLPTSADFGSSVAVHDPSVFKDPKSGKYYAFGTHFAVASSDDLIHWTQENRDGNAKALYGKDDWRSVVPQSDKLVGGNENTWAPDVEYIDGLYYMYYSITSGFGSNKSVIGRVSSIDIMGPYSDEQVIVNSTGGGNEPNCIDPELFYDKDGKLYMVYGSFYEGIFIKELNDNGLPKEDGFGTKVWQGKAGAGNGPEGPFVFYNAALDYYYLMVSDGSLSDTYNMRVARSKNPLGPYEDISGKDMAAAYGNGNKLAGNYRFSGDRGYAALGHNSVIKVDGKYLVVYHTRYMDSDGYSITGYHNVQVNQLYFNEEGWPVLSPNRYVGETAGTVTQEKVAGEYDVVVHSTGNNANFIDSVRYTLAADGTVKRGSDSVGSWTLKQNYYVEITVNNVVYKGVVAPGWKNYGTAKGVLSITATSDAGRSLWANAV